MNRRAVAIFQYNQYAKIFTIKSWNALGAFRKFFCALWMVILFSLLNPTVRYVYLKNNVLNDSLIRYVLQPVQLRGD